MDSRPVESKGIIENLNMKLAAYPEIEINMNVLVLDIPDTWGMLLSREWVAKLGGSIQMDLSYATIPIGENALYKLVNEKPMTKHVETPEHLFEEAMRPTEEVGNYIVMANYWEEPQQHTFPPSQVWKMHFDGAKSRHGAGAGIVLISLFGEEKYFSFRLEFEATNNMAEYEDLLLGLEIARDQKIKCLSVIGDLDLIVSQAKNQFAAKNNRLRDYRDVVWDTIEMFDAFAIQAVPREESTLADALLVIACTFEIPNHLKEQCKVEV